MDDRYGTVSRVDGAQERKNDSMIATKRDYAGVILPIQGNGNEFLSR